MSMPTYLAIVIIAILLVLLFSRIIAWAIRESGTDDEWHALREMEKRIEIDIKSALKQADKEFKQRQRLRSVRFWNF